VATRGIKVPLREGVNGAEVGTILEAGFGTVSSRIIVGGCAWGNPNPGGTDGVDTRDK